MADLGDGLSCAELVAREEQTLVADVGMQAVTCIGFELLHEVIAAQEDVAREHRDREVVCKMLVDLGEHFLDLGVV